MRHDGDEDTGNGKSTAPIPCVAFACTATVPPLAPFVDWLLRRHWEHVDVGAVFCFRPENALCHHGLGIQRYAVQDHFLELVVPCSVNQVPAVQIHRFVLQHFRRKLLPILHDSNNDVLCDEV